MNWPIAQLRRPLVLAIVFAASTTISVSAQSPKTAEFRVEPVKQLRKGVDAWPLIVLPSTPAAQKVNATLTRQNGLLIQSLNDCDRNLREWMKMSHFPSGKNEVEKDWLRKVKVTMLDSHFLSLLATDEVFCGGAHPDSDTSTMVFDMKTGLQVNWLTMVAGSAGASEFSDTISDGRTVSGLVLPALQKVNIAATDPDCKDAFRDRQSFLVWPDAKNGTLVALPFDLPHVVQACAREINLTMEQARKIGFDERLLSAIDLAHDRAVGTPKH